MLITIRTYLFTSSQRTQGLQQQQTTTTAREIAHILQVSSGTVNTAFLRKQAKDNIRRYIDERLPEEYEKCLVGLNAILREA